VKLGREKSSRPAAKYCVLGSNNLRRGGKTGPKKDLKIKEKVGVELGRGKGKEYKKG